MPEQVVGTWPYVAPEVWTSSFFSQASDIYSLGITLWELYEQQLPFSDLRTLYASEGQLISRIHDNNIRPKFEIIAEIQDLQKLIENLWHREQSLREKISLPKFVALIQQLRIIEQKKMIDKKC